MLQATYAYIAALSLLILASVAMQIKEVESQVEIAKVLSESQQCHGGH